MPTENGLPQYVSRDDKSKNYQYYRRPPTGVKGAAFSRSFKTKDRRVMMAAYAAVHAEAEKHIARLISGRALTDSEIEKIVLTLPMAEAMFKSPRAIASRIDLDRFIDTHGDERVRALTGPDRERLKEAVDFLNRKVEAGHLGAFEHRADAQRKFMTKRFGPSAAPAPANTFTLKDAYEQGWKPSKARGKNTVVEVGRYVEEFEALNGKLDLAAYTRQHWAAWRKDCLTKHGPGPTAFKRFSMMKTVVHESIRAGLFERKDFGGQDVSMVKTARNKARNEGWLQDELTEFFGAPVFRGAKDSPHPDADYWSAVIIAYTGAAIIEVSNMNTSDVAERHSYWTFRLWRTKSKNSERIIPIPQQILDLGFLEYVRTRPKHGPLFATADGNRVSNKLMSQTFSRMRADLGITRKGANAHSYRHHIKTVLADLGAPERVNDYVTGHAPPNVGRTYGKVEFSTALQYLNRVDLGVTIPKWKPS
ncbi:MAG: tyrosine-type recombinase/integrase [Reyranella sp.]|nr:tyrosine-type recombinase/integrase [Reyranella sp.]